VADPVSADGILQKTGKRSTVVGILSIVAEEGGIAAMKQQPAQRGVHRFLRFLVHHNMAVLTAVLACASAYFYQGTREIRAKTRYSNPEEFSDRDRVTILEIIDGEDVLIRNEKGAKTRLRILGIDTFSPTLSDPLLSEYGKICVQHLKARVKGKEALLSVPEKRIGHTGRLLGYLSMEDPSGGGAIDIGEDLVRKGYALVYTRYGFARMDAYLAVEAEAREAKAGFWSDPNVAARAAAQKLLWEEERGAAGD